MQKALPKGWKMVRLGEEKVVQIIMGQSPPSSSYNAEGIGLPFYQGKAEFGEHHPKTVKWCSQPGKIAEADDILMSVRAPVGDVNICKEKSCIGRGLVAIRINRASLNNKFLYYFLKRDTSIWNKLSTGSTFDSITSKTLQSLPIPLPPLPTQHKIVEILEEADSLRKLRQQADEKMKDLIPSLFIKMFGDPATNPKGWEVKKLGEVTGIVSGSTPRTNVPEYWNGDILWITPADLSNLATIEINDSERKITKEGYASCSTTILPIGTVLLSSRAPIGHLAIAGKEMCTNQGFKSLIPQTSLHSYYLYFALRYFKERLISLGSGATFKEISKSSVEKFEIPLPPLPLQQEFAKLVEVIEAEKAKQAESRKNLDELFNSLMQQAFTGELVACGINKLIDKPTSSHLMSGKDL